MVRSLPFSELRQQTVGKHLERIYPKLDVENRTAAASFLPRHKLCIAIAQRGSEANS